MTISNWIKKTTQRFHQAEIGSPRLDAELIISHVLNKPREWLLAHGDFELEKEIIEKAEEDIQRRLNREPLAYILGEKEFYGRKFVVDRNVLVPRPESEQIISQLAQILPSHFKKAAPSATAEARKIGLSPVTTGRHPICASRNDSAGFPRLKILDVGTGSGALAITVALEFPTAQVTASDISDAALKIAKQNARKLGAKANFVKSDLLNAFQNTDTRNKSEDDHADTNNQFSNTQCNFDIILANLPYGTKNWLNPTNISAPELAHEPQIALFAADDGLALIKKLIADAPKILNKNGFLILEMDPRQIKAVKKFAAEKKYRTIDEWPFGLSLQLN